MRYLLIALLLCSPAYAKSDPGIQALINQQNYEREQERIQDRLEYEQEQLEERIKELEDSKE